MLILYGSQTGTAQDIAERIWRTSKRISIPNLRIYTMDDYNILQLPNERFIIFICSTTGQGDEPDNMKRFWRFLCRRNLPNSALGHLYVAVLGLGDSSYQKFNYVAKKLYRRLSQLGAQQLLPLGLADDQHEFGYDWTVEMWTKDLWTAVESKCQILFDRRIEFNRNGEGERWLSKYQITGVDPATSDSSGKTLDENFTNNSDLTAVRTKDELYSQSNPYLAELIGNDRVTAPDHFQDTRLVRFSITNSGIDFLPGDVVYIQPKNLEETKTEFLNLLGHFDPDQPFEIIPNDSCFTLPPKSILPRPCTLRQCADSYFDIPAIPRRSFFALLAAFAPADSLEKEKLLEFASTEGQEEYFSYCTRPRRTIVETMGDFPQTIPNVPLECWFDLISPIRPRSFSIASCLDTHPDEIQILLAVVRYKTRLRSTRLGLCSNWLSRLPVSSKVQLWVRKGTILFPFEKSSPCIMIGPGTGVAPFRSFLHWRSSRRMNENILFFGCRNERNDFYFRSELERMIENGTLKLFTAFSRDTIDKENGKKIYVQNKIRENGKLVAEMIVERGAHVFVAGNAKQMPNDVLDALKNVIGDYFNRRMEDKNGSGEDDWSEYLAKLEKEKRLQMETWS